MTDDPLSRAKAGDRSAFDELVGPLVEQGFRLAFGMLHDREAAEDAVQEATVRSWRKLGNLKPGADVRPWFLAIVANQCRTVARGRWWSVIRLGGTPRVGGTDFEDRIVRGADLRAALRKLAMDQREVLVLRYYLDLSFEEVGKILRISTKAARSRTYRALEKLRLSPEVIGDA